MKKYLVIGNPIEHSSSPLIHNYWMKKYNLVDCVYEKKKVEERKEPKLAQGHGEFLFIFHSSFYQAHQFRLRHKV